MGEKLTIKKYVRFYLLHVFQVLIHHRGTSADLTGLGAVGSRRTVYLSEDDAVAAPPPIPVAADAPDIAEEPPGDPHLQQQQHTPPLLVYNRVSTTIGQLQEPRAQNSPQSHRKEEEQPEKEIGEESGIYRN
nr:unnamed protein product [Callosobruchus analis]